MIAFGEKLASVYPQGRLVMAVNNINLRILLTVLLLSPFIAAIGVYLSHKIAGPIVRMERFMDDMAAGNLSSRLVLRKGDELTKLADGINHISDTFKAAIINERSSLERLEKALHDLRTLTSAKHPDPAAIDNLVSKINSDMLDLRNEVDKFRTEYQKS
jgi:signal transduction histidine kinase